MVPYILDRYPSHPLRLGNHINTDNVQLRPALSKPTQPPQPLHEALRTKCLISVYDFRSSHPCVTHAAIGYVSKLFI